MCVGEPMIYLPSLGEKGHSAYTGPETSARLFNARSWEKHLPSSIPVATCPACPVLSGGGEGS